MYSILSSVLAKHRSCSIVSNKKEGGNYLSAPLALQASFFGDLAVPSVHEFLQAVDLGGVVHVDLEGQLGTVPSLGPRVGPKELLLRRVDVVGGEEGARGEGAVEEPGEEEGGNHEEQGPDLVRAGAEEGLVVMVMCHWSRFVAGAGHCREDLFSSVVMRAERNLREWAKPRWMELEGKERK